MSLLRTLTFDKQNRVQKVLIVAAVAASLWKVYRKVKFLSDDRHSLPAGDARLLPEPRSLFGRYFRSNKTGLWIYRRRWIPLSSAKPNGIVFVIHGFGEHCGRYEHVAKLLNDEGFVVLSMDHQGHGQSEGDRAHVQSFSDYVDDVIQYVDQEAKEYEGSGIPLFLLGHSMGGTIATHVASKTQSMWRGVILSGPALMPDPKVATPFLKSLAGVMSIWLPKLRVTKLDPDLVSREPAVVQNYKADPLVYHDGMKCRWSYEFLQAMDAALACASTFTIPFLVLHGECDGLVLPEGSRRFFESLTIRDKQISVYPKMFHEILNDPERDLVLSDVLAWLKQRCDA